MNIIFENNRSHLSFYLISLLALFAIFTPAILLIFYIIHGFFESVLILGAIMPYLIISILFFLDVESVVRPSGFINIPALLFLLVALFPLYVIAFPHIFANEDIPLMAASFYLIFYGWWCGLVIIKYGKALKETHPGLCLVLAKRAGLFIMLGWLLAANIGLSFTFDVGLKETIFVIPFFILCLWVALRYGAPFLVYARNLERGKEGKKIIIRAKEDNWQKEAGKSPFIRIVEYILIPVMVISIFFSSLALSYGLTSGNIILILVAVFGISASTWLLFYRAFRVGSLARIARSLIREKKEAPSLESVKEKLRYVQKFSEILFALVIAAIGSFTLNKSSRFILNVFGLELTDMGVCYTYVIVLLAIIFSSEFLKRNIKNYSLKTLNKAAGFIDTTSFYLAAPITGTLAYSLGVPMLLDAILIAFLLTVLTIIKLLRWIL